MAAAVRATVLQAFSDASSTAVSLPAGAQVEVLHKDDAQEWWYVKSPTAGQGYFPAALLRIETAAAAPAAAVATPAAAAAATAAAPGGLPAGWVEAKNEQGIPYYFHAATNTAQWERPAGAAAAGVAKQEQQTRPAAAATAATAATATATATTAAASTAAATASTTASAKDDSDALPTGWKQCVSPQGHTYYFNTLTQQSQWERPAVVSRDQVLSGAGTAAAAAAAMGANNAASVAALGYGAAAGTARMATTMGGGNRPNSMMPLKSTSMNLDAERGAGGGGAASGGGGGLGGVPEDGQVVGHRRVLSDRQQQRQQESPLQQAVTRLTTGDMKQRKLSKEKSYSPAFVYLSDDLEYLCWARGRDKSGAKAVALNTLTDVVRQAPSKSKGRDQQKEGFRESTFTCTCTKESNNMDFWSNTPAICQDWVQALRLIIPAIRQFGSLAAALQDAQAAMPSEDLAIPPQGQARSAAPTGAAVAGGGGGGAAAASGFSGGVSLPQLPPTLAQDIHQFQMEGYAERFFKVKKGFFSKTETTADMISFSSKPISKPLTEVPRSMVSQAKQIFQQIMRYMGDDGSGNVQGDMNILRQLVRTASQNEELRDEVFCQLVKQTRDNPWSASNERGWELLAACTASFPPNSLELTKSVAQHASEMRMEANAIGGFAFYVYRNLAEMAAEAQATGRAAQVSAKILTRQDLEALAHHFVPNSVYGVSLEQVLVKEAFMTNPDSMLPPPGALLDENAVPQIMEMLFAALERVGGFQTDGIFRRAAETGDVSFFRAELETGNYRILLGEPCSTGAQLDDPLVVADLLKVWLRQLTPPLITYELYPLCVDAGKASDRMGMQQCLQRMRAANRATLISLAKHLKRMSTNVAVTQMDEHNLSLVVAPNILRNPTDDPMMFAANSDSEIRFLQLIVEEANSL